jgi:hypothetical protein
MIEMCAALLRRFIVFAALILVLPRLADAAGARSPGSPVTPVFPPIEVPQTPPPPILNPGVTPVVPGPTAIVPSPRNSAGLATTVIPGPAPGFLPPRTRAISRGSSKQTQPSRTGSQMNREIDQNISICRGC